MIESNNKRAQKQQMQVTTCQTNTRIKSEQLMQQTKYQVGKHNKTLSKKLINFLNKQVWQQNHFYICKAIRPNKLYVKKS